MIEVWKGFNLIRNLLFLCWNPKWYIRLVLERFYSTISECNSLPNWTFLLWNLFSLYDNFMFRVILCISSQVSIDVILVFKSAYGIVLVVKTLIWTEWGADWSQVYWIRLVDTFPPMSLAFWVLALRSLYWVFTLPCVVRLLIATTTIFVSHWNKIIIQ